MNAIPIAFTALIMVIAVVLLLKDIYEEKRNG